METDAQNANSGELWDRLLLLLISQPREGWESEYQQLAERETRRVLVPTEERNSDE